MTDHPRPDMGNAGPGTTGKEGAGPGYSAVVSNIMFTTPR